MSDPLVSLAIPGRNCAATIRDCLSAVVPMLERPACRLGEIIFIDDGSTDETARIVAEFPITCLPGSGTGPGAGRNLGWQAARFPLVWFVDADCVSEPDALVKLLHHMDDPDIGGVSGSYGIMNPHSLLACLIHEEIVQRHLRMGPRVDFLATFNVLYRRSVLEQVGGFNERYLKAQDAELSFRVAQAGYTLGFEMASKVNHYHATRWRPYLRTQRQQGYWRVWLHLAHKGHSTGDSYSSALDHLQPPLAVLSLATAPLLAMPPWRWMPIACTALLAVAQLPLCARLVRRLKHPKYLTFACMSFLRAYWRGLGMTLGTLSYLANRLRPSQQAPAQQPN